MKKLFSIIVFAASLALMSFSGEPDGHKILLGNWKYQVTTAPPGLDSGTLSFSEQEGKLLGTIKTIDGTELNMQDLIFEKEQLRFGVTVDYNYVLVKAMVKGKELTGTVDSPEGVMQLSAKKEEKKVSK
ncbi:MAG: hypothetical protein ACK5M7_20235 [Draconibacterium sp.]